MRAGNLRHRITIWQRIETRDAAGGIDYSYSVFASRVPARIEPARVMTSFGGAQQQNNFDVLISLRWMPGVRTSMRVTWQDAESGSPTAEKVYEITGVRVRDEVRHEQFLHCVERQADGWRRL